MNELELREHLDALKQSNREQADYAKKAFIMSMISAVCTVCILVAVLVCLGSIMPKVDRIAQEADAIVADLNTLIADAGTTVGNVNRVVTDAGTTIGNLNRITSDIVNNDVDGMLKNINTLVSDTTAGVNGTMDKLNSIDFEQLNTAIKDLADVIQPLADFFGRFRL